MALSLKWASPAITPPEMLSDWSLLAEQLWLKFVTFSRTVEPSAVVPLNSRAPAKELGMVPQKPLPAYQAGQVHLRRLLH